MTTVKPFKRLSLTDEHFLANKYAYYAHLRQYAPVHVGQVSVLKVHLVARYEDCLTVVKDPRFVRDRRKLGGRRMPFPVPKRIAPLMESMIVADDPEHRRLRTLVQKAFSPKSIASLECAVEQLTHQLVDQALARGEIDAQRDYALPVPVKVIAQIVGAEDDDMPRFQSCLRVMTDGFSGWGVVRTLAFDMPKAITFMREMIARKAQRPGDDILTALIQAEEAGDQLTEDELVSMLFLLIIAGYETTVHLISNGLVALLQHPEQMQRLRAQPELLGSAVEEMLRFCGPIHGTKMNYATQDIELAHGVIPKGAPAMPLLGAANHDEDVFVQPEVFDVARDPNRHLGFSQGNHFCLGAFLARMETRVALKTLLARTSEIKLATDHLTFQKMPAWHRYQGVPIQLTA